MYSFIYEEQVRNTNNTRGFSTTINFVGVGEEHTIASSSHHEFSNDNGRRQISCIRFSFLVNIIFIQQFFFCFAVRRNLYVKNLIFLPCRTACKMKNILYRCSKQKMIWCNIGTYIQRSVTWKISGLLSIK